MRKYLYMLFAYQYAMFLSVYVCTYVCVLLIPHKHSCSETAASVESLQCDQILQTYGANFGGKSVREPHSCMHKAVASGYVGLSVCLCTFDLWILVCDRAILGHS